MMNTPRQACALSVPSQPRRPRSRERGTREEPSPAPIEQYKKELDKKSSADEIGDPPCGDWGDAPDGIQYFEAQPGARKVLFVRVGQDVPLFDEKTLRVIGK